jgi:hypothetical protein
LHQDKWNKGSTPIILGITTVAMVISTFEYGLHYHDTQAIAPNYTPLSLAKGHVMKDFFLTRIWWHVGYSSIMFGLSLCMWHYLMSRRY